MLRAPLHRAALAVLAHRPQRRAAWTALLFLGYRREDVSSTRSRWSLATWRLT
jgi:hypothetical protein